MHLNFIAFAIPAFFLFLCLEYLIIKQRSGGNQFFKFNSSVANISIGIAERLLNLFIAGSFYELFYFIYENFSLFAIPNHWVVWILLILATDLVWYWYHRLGHEINLLWGAHIVHHQSEEFNYTVSARITTIQAIARNCFWCILPWLGFHPAMVITMLVVHGAYSFFTHTQMVRKLGILEYVLITPSHHRVHHASNEKYLNKNYGDIFVFWDKLFGTFQKEEEEPVYGLTHPLKSYSFMWQHFHYYAELAEACARARGIFNKLRILFGRPEQLDQDIRVELEKKYFPHKHHVRPSFRFRTYVMLQLIVSVVLTFYVTLLFNEISAVDKVFCVFIVLLTLTNCGALLEQRKWICYLECLRLALVMGYISYLMESVQFLIISWLAILVMIIVYPMQRWYWKVVYGH